MEATSTPQSFRNLMWLSWLLRRTIMNLAELRFACFRVRMESHHWRHATFNDKCLLGLYVFLWKLNWLKFSCLWNLLQTNITKILDTPWRYLWLYLEISLESRSKFSFFQCFAACKTLVVHDVAQFTVW